MRTSLWLVGLLLISLLGGCKGVSDGDIPVIGNPDEYNQTLGEAEGLSKDALQRFSNDEDLSEADKQNLVKASRLFEGLRAYEPTKFAPYLALGMIYRSVGNLERAEQYLQQSLVNLPASNAPEIRESAAEAHYQLSRTLFDERKYDQALAEASTAAQMSPNTPNYLVAQASAMVQLKRFAEAKNLVNQALKLDPKHKRAAGLQKLLK